jgi:hypothetical protein
MRLQQTCDTDQPFEILLEAIGDLDLVIPDAATRRVLFDSLRPAIAQPIVFRDVSDSERIAKSYRLPHVYR